MESRYKVGNAVERVEIKGFDYLIFLLCGILSCLIVIITMLARLV